MGKKPELFRLRNFCVRETADEIGVILDKVSYLTNILNVNTVEEIYQTEQYEKLKKKYGEEEDTLRKVFGRNIFTTKNI